VIAGEVRPDRQAVIRLVVRGPESASRCVEAVVDTGFNSYLTLPSDLVAELGLQYLARGRARLADGSVITTRYFRAEVEWDGQARPIRVLEAAGGPLVGMSLLYGCDLRIAVIDGGEVTIALLAEPLSAR